MTSVYDEIIYWERRMTTLENRINSYSRVKAWTAEIIMEVERIECYLEECEDELNMLYSEIDKLEWVYD